MQTKRISDQEWIAAHEAVSLLQRTHGSRPVIKAMLADMLRDNELRLRASMYWRTTTKEFWSSPPPDALINTEISYLEWWQNRRWKKDVRRWIWKNDLFFSTFSKNPFERTIMKGVSFRRDEIVRLAKTGQSKPPRGGGRRPNAELWMAFALALVEATKRGELEKGKHATIQKLLEAINGSDLLTEHDFSLKPIVAELFKAFVDPIGKVRTED